MVGKRKSVSPSSAPVKHPEWLWHDDAFRDRCPSLFEFLAAGDWEGEPRKGGSISLFTSQQRLKVCFLDKQTQKAFYAPIDPTGDILEALEQLLAGEHDPWEPVRSPIGKPVF